MTCPVAARALSAILTGALTCGLAASAWAFRDAQLYAEPASVGGGGGVYYTGSPRARRYDCSVCHAGWGLPAHAPHVEVTSSPAELMADGTWTAGQTYRITVTLVDEELGLDASDNTNSLAAEIDSDTGAPVGTFAAGTATETLDNNHVIAGINMPGQSTWSFDYVAPITPERLTLYLAVVDGDSKGDAGGSDSLGDGVFRSAWRLCPPNTACDRAPPPAPTIDHSSPATACRIAVGPATPGPVALGVLLALSGGLVVARRRRRTR